MRTDRAEAQAAGHVSHPTAFERSVLELLDRVEYRRCDNGEDKEAVYRLRYKANHAHGVLGEMEDQRLSDELDEKSNCYCFGIFIDGNLVSSVRLSHLSLAMPYAPIMTVFSDMLTPRLARGETFIDPSRLVVDPDLPVNRALPYVTLRLAVMALTYFDCTSCVSMVREEHTGFYNRIFGSVQMGGPRPYPPFTRPLYFYESRCELNMEPTLARFSFFRSTAFERRMLFERPQAGELAPLTVLPTARYQRRAA